MRYEIDGQRPVTAPDAFIAPTATLVGNATVGAGASVWFGAVIRADGDAVSLGERSNLQDNAVVHADPGFPARIGDDVSIGHAAVIHGCTIGDRVLIGMGATVMNGAVIGPDTLVAAGALISEGTTIPPRSLVVGVPGEVRRSLEPDEVARVARNAAVYVDRARQYAAGGRLLED